METTTWAPQAPRHADSRRSGLSAQDVAEDAAAGAAPAGAARRSRDPALGRLDQEPSRSGEPDLDGLARAATDECLHVHVGLDGAADSARPRDRRLRVGEGLLAIELN